MQAYKSIDKGFCLSLDMSLYARPAVMKALYKYHDQFVISYESQGERLFVYFETMSPLPNVEEKVSEILKELSFQMIRYDTMKRTSQVRQLLVARALYATCIEDSRTIDSDIEAGSDTWKEDKRNIFSSWSSEQE